METGIMKAMGLGREEILELVKEKKEKKEKNGKDLGVAGWFG